MDGSGLAPHSKQWFDYWGGKIDQIIAGEDPHYAGRMPLDVIDSIIAAAKNDREARTSATPD